MLITEIAKEHGLNKIPSLGLFTENWYGRSELHPYSDIDLFFIIRQAFGKK